MSSTRSKSLFPPSICYQIPAFPPALYYLHVVVRRIASCLSITFLQDRDGNKKEKKVKEQEKKEKDMIIFQEMITIPNQEEIDELVEGNLELKPQVHTTLEKSEKRLTLSSTRIRHENWAFWKPSSNRRNLKTLALRLSVERKHLKESFSKTMTSR